MALLFCLRKTLVNVLKTDPKILYERNISTTQSLLWINERLTRLDSFKAKEQRFLEKDKVPPNYELVYKVPLESYIVLPMHVSTVTSFIIGSAAIYQFAAGLPLVEPTGTALTMQSEDIYYFTAGFLAINAMLRLVISMCALRIYKDQENYLAVYHSQLPFGISHNRYKKGQVKAVYYRFSPWNAITYKLGEKTSLLIEIYFKTPSEFHEMQDLRLEK